MDKNNFSSSKISLAVALMMAAASLAGIFFQPALYPTDALRRSFVSNDVVNLFIGLPILLGSVTLIQRGKLLGSLLLPGALLYVAYNYIAYLIATWFAPQSLLYALLVALSLYGVWLSIVSMNGIEIQEQLRGAVPERFAGGVLMAFGLLFFFRGIGQIYTALTNSASLFTPEMAVTYADLLTTPLWVIGGWALWQKREFGYKAGLGLLFQASMLFIGLLVFFILQPFLAGVPFPMNDFVVILVMGLLFFIPFGLFLRGAVSKEI